MEQSDSKELGDVIMAETEGGASESGVSELIQINVKMLHEEKISVEVPLSMSVLEFKKSIIEIIGATDNTPESLRLIFTGKVLKNDQRLQDYNIESGQTVHALFRQNAPTSSRGEVESSPENSSSPTSVSEGSGGQNMSFSSIPGSQGILGRIEIPESSFQDIGSIIGNVIQGMTGSMSSATSSPPTVHVMQMNTANRENQTTEIAPTVVGTVELPSTNHEEQTPSLIDQSHFSSQRRYTASVRSIISSLDVPMDDSVEQSTVDSMVRSIGEVIEIFGQSTGHLQRLSNLLNREETLSNNTRQQTQEYAHRLAPVLLQIGTLANQLGMSLLNMDMGERAGGVSILSAPSSIPMTSMHHEESLPLPSDSSRASSDTRATGSASPVRRPVSNTQVGPDTETSHSSTNSGNPINPMAAMILQLVSGLSSGSGVQIQMSQPSMASFQTNGISTNNNSSSESSHDQGAGSSPPS